MPAKSQKQQKLFGMALAQAKGKMKGASKKEITKFAKTKRKGLTESFVLSFGEFINEAYVDEFGELKDFELTPEEEFRVNTHDNIVSIGNFLEDAGADELSHNIDDAFLTFEFSYHGKPFAMRLDLDNDTTEVISQSTDIPIYSGDTDSLFDLIKANGLSFLFGI